MEERPSEDRQKRSPRPRIKRTTADRISDFDNNISNYNNYSRPTRNNNGNSVNRGYRNYNREERDFNREDRNFNQEDRNFNRDFNREDRNFNRDFNREDRNFNRDFNREDRNFNREERNFNREERNFNRDYNSRPNKGRNNNFNNNNNKKRPVVNNKKKPFNKKVNKSNNGSNQAEISPIMRPYRDNTFDKGEVRLNRFLAASGVCSRREADEYIKAGCVRVNGSIVTEMGIKISLEDKVQFNDDTIRSEQKVYILLNKPKDYITTNDDPRNRRTVFELIKNACRERVFAVGRLDRNTTGLLLFTNDGELASKLIHPRFDKKKIYHVVLNKKLLPSDMANIKGGFILDDGPVQVDELMYTGEDKREVGIEIHSGKNRIVRRIFEHFGYEVEKLDRVYFCGLTKKNLPRGKWRYLDEQEVAMLQRGAFE